MSDAINPSHYKDAPAGIKGEAIDYTRQMSFCQGSAFKYVFRAGSKDNTVQDLQKALWYVLDAAEQPKPMKDIPLITDVSVPVTRRRYVLGCIARADWYKASVLIRDLIEHPEHLGKELR